MLTDEEAEFLKQADDRKKRTEEEKIKKEQEKAELLKPYEGKSKDEFLAE
jgi:hypothetical protein